MKVAKLGEPCRSSLRSACLRSFLCPPAVMLAVLVDLASVPTLNTILKSPSLSGARGSVGRVIASPPLPAANPPAPPSDIASVTLPDTSKYVHKTVCTAGCSYKTLRDAVKAAVCGTVISAKAGGSEDMSSFSIPNRACDEAQWIILATSDCSAANLASCSHLPPPDTSTSSFGGRVSPSLAEFMYKLKSSCTGENVLETASGANHYRFIGIEVDMSGCSNENGAGMYLGASGAPNDPSTRMIVDRCYIHGDATHNSAHGVIITAQNSAVIDSYISEIHNLHGVGSDTQAILLPGVGTAGYLIQNNFLSAASEVFMAGGGGFGNAFDITIQYNYIYKNPSWNPHCTGQPTCNGQSYGGHNWGVKNSLELKAAVRALIQGNVIDYDWYDGQQGECFQITPRSTQNGSTARVNDITIQYNLCRHVGQGINIAGADNEDNGWNTATMGVQTNRLLFQHNLLIDTMVSPWVNPSDSSQASFGVFLYVDTPGDLQVTHNTFVNGGTSSAASLTSNVYKGVYYNPPNPRATNCTFKDNIFQNGTYGWEIYDGPGNGTEGTAALNFVCNSTTAPWIFTNMAIVGGSRRKYPATTLTPSNWAAVHFVNYRGPNWNVTDYQLQNSSPLHNAASDGTDVGANVKMVDGCTAGVIAGTPKGCPNSTSPR